jgi:hypothetical protein
MIAAQEMMAANDPLEFQIPFSTYGVALRTLQLIGGTGSAVDAQDGDVIAEDHHLFIKGFFATEGKLQVHPIYLPCLNFAVGGDSQPFCKNIHDRYVQAKRHMFGISELFFFLVMVLRGSWCCRQWNSGCRGRFRTLNLFWKLLKIHSIPYLGLWVMLGVLLQALLNVDKAFCERQIDDETIHDQIKPRVCLQAISQATNTTGFVTFGICAAGTFVGSFGILISFVRMLKATQHTLMNIANPQGSFMAEDIFDPRLSVLSIAEDGSGTSLPRTSSAESRAQTESRRPNSPSRRRLVAVGGGFPWFGTLLQLLVEFLVLGFISSVLFGAVPAIIAVCIFVRQGHTLEYVTAPKPGTGTADARNVEISQPSGSV